MASTDINDCVPSAAGLGGAFEKLANTNPNIEIRDPSEALKKPFQSFTPINFEISLGPFDWEFLGKFFGGGGMGGDVCAVVNGDPDALFDGYESVPLMSSVDDMGDRLTQQELASLAQQNQINQLQQQVDSN